MTACHLLAAGRIELFFYGELPPIECEAIERHVAGCRECQEALADLRLIESALAAGATVDAPPSGDWPPFMARLHASLGAEQRRPGHSAARRAALATWMAAAALLALVTVSVLMVAGARTSPTPGSGEGAGQALGVAEASLEVSDTGITTVGQQHLERSKLVLLGLASRDVEQTGPADWHYERELAGRLLDDTRLYRLAAEQRGMAAMADVLRDLEFVLLQTSMAEGEDRADLTRIQRAIHKRDLLHKVALSPGS